MMFAYPGRGEGGQRLLPFLGGTIPASEFVIQSIGFFAIFSTLFIFEPRRHRNTKEQR